MSIDDLLSDDSLILSAQEENSPPVRKFCLAGVLDVSAVFLILLPLYGNPVGHSVRPVNLILFTAVSPAIRMICWSVLTGLIITGILELLLIRSGKDNRSVLIGKFSLFVSILAILFFASVREPYVLALLFMLFLAKLFLMIRQEKLR